MNDETIICRCEEVTYGDLRRAAELGLVTPGDIRKYTRAGMGSCQGRTCQRLMMRAIRQALTHGTIAEETAYTRLPIQPVRFDALAGWEQGE